MRTLIVGDKSFVRFKIAERFNKEGHNVIILGKKDEINDSRKIYKSYDLKLKDEKVRQIFEGRKVNNVIYIPKFEKIDRVDYGMEFTEFKLLLNMCEEYGMDKLIILSSTKVYGQLNINKTDFEDSKIFKDTDQKLNYTTIESYAKSFNETSKTKVICLRVSTIYGENQDIKNSLYYLIKEKITKNNQEIAQDYYEDYIYVGDVVDAIYKANQFANSFLFNISTYTLIKSSDIKKLISKIENGEKIINENLKKHINFNIGISNQKAIKELNWYPKYNFLDELEKVYSSLKEFILSEKDESKNEEQIKKNTIIPYLENLITFIAILILELYLSSKGIEVVLDLKIIYIAVIAIIYGLSQSLIATILSIGLYIYTMSNIYGGIIGTLYNPNTLLNISIYIFIGGVLGYIIDNKNNEVKEIEEKVKEVEERFQFVQYLYKDTVKANSELEYQVSVTEDSIGKVYSIIKKIDNLEPEQILEKSIEVIEGIMKSKDISIYVIDKENEYLRLVANSSTSKVIEKKSLYIKDTKLAKYAIENKKLMANKKLEANVPMFISPVIVNSEVKALIFVEDINFESLTLYNENLLTVITSLITNFLEKAYRYEQSVLEKKYIKNTDIINPNYFKNILINKLKENEGLNFVLLKTESEINNKDYKLLKEELRVIDLLGSSNNNKFLILLQNTDIEEGDIVINKLKQKGILTKQINVKEYLEKYL